MGLFHALMPFLGFQAKRRDGPCLKPAQTDRLAGFLTVSVSVIIDALQGLVDFRDELAGPVAGAQLQGPVRLGRRPVGNIGFQAAPFLQMLQGFAGFVEWTLSKLRPNSPRSMEH